jgi:hypothetical protein
MSRFSICPARNQIEVAQAAPDPQFPPTIVRTIGLHFPDHMDKFLSHRPKILIAASLAIISAILVSCGGNDAQAPATAVTVATTPAKTILDLGDADDLNEVGSNVPVFTGPRVSPVTEPIPGSDEEKILDTFDRWVYALSIEDWDGYLAECNPNEHMFTPNQLEFVADTFFKPFGDLAGTNYRNVTVELLGNDLAKTDAALYSFNNLLFSGFAYSWSKVDGRWYTDSSCD